jgi:hypothetical protein
MKAQWQNFLQGLKLAVVFCPGLLLTGCETARHYSLTYKLWDNTNLSSFDEPSPEPRLALFDVKNGNDVLVQYDSVSDKRNGIERRAYFLQPNRARIETRKKPRFVNLSTVGGLKVIPVFSVETTNKPSLEPYAVVASDGRQFTLYRGNDNPELCKLPVYEEASGNLTRTALTPLAVTGDTLMVGGVAAFVGFILWVEAGAPGVNCH